ESMPLGSRDVLGIVSNLLDPSGRELGGLSVMVDGLPSFQAHIPLARIREIRVDNNPFSAEYSRPGSARIEIITNSGSSEYHGALYYTLRNYRFDARNAFAANRPAEGRNELEANLGGPLRKASKTSFSLYASRTQDNLQPAVYAFGINGPIIENSQQTQRDTFFSMDLTRKTAKDSPISLGYSHYGWTETGAGAGGFVLPEGAFDSIQHSDDFHLGYQMILSPNLLNAFTVQLRTERGSSLSLLSNMPKIVVQDAFTAGGAQIDSRSTDSRLQFGDLLTWSHGRHFIKAGFGVPALGRIGLTDGSERQGTFYFSSLEDYINGRPYSFTKQIGDGHIAYWQNYVTAFVQDEVKLRTNLSVAAGLRYETQKYLHDYNNFAPRLSLAFAPSLIPKTVLRAGAGLFYEGLPARAAGDKLRLNGNGLRQILLNDPTYPDPFSSIPAATALPPNIVRFSPTLSAPYTFQYSFGIEHQFRPSLGLSTTYRQARGVKQFRSRDINAPYLPYIARPDPTIGVLRQIESSGSMMATAWDTTIKTKASRFWSGSITYQLRHTMRDTEGINSFPANDWDLRGEWARSSSDVRHFLYVYGTFDVGKLFSLGTIFSAGTGRPYTMTTGRDDYNNGRANARPFGVARNTLQGTGDARFDFRWSRTFTLGHHRLEGLSLTPSIDAFNVFNRVNYDSFVGNISSPFFRAPVSSSPARRLQVSMYMQF
ncbi:MAG TPA: hypothetical protein VKY31_07415, partial [Terriglobia bacterium]|nr:hypothetical protein [Terriglobia bacterium]